MTNFSGGRTTTSLLSFLPLSAPGSLDNASGGMLVFPGMYRISKSYSCRSACQQAVWQFRFFGDFQYCRFAWSVMIVKGSFVHPR